MASFGSAFAVSPLSASSITNFAIDVAAIAAQQGGGTGLVYVNVTDNLEGKGIVGDPLRVVDNIHVVSVNATDDITAANILSSSVVTANSVTGSLKGNGAQVTNITSSNISNFTNDTRAQLSGSQYVSYNTSSGVISLPFTGSTLGTKPVILGQTVTDITGLNSISASLGTFTTLTASNGNMGNLTVGNLYAGSIYEDTSSVQPLVAGTQIVPTTSLVKVSSSSGLDITLTASPVIKIAGYPEGTRITVVNVGTGKITFTKDVGNTTRLKLVGGKSFAALEFECIPFVLVSGSSGFYWCEATRGA